MSNNSHRSYTTLLRDLGRHLSPHRRKQLYFLLILMLVGSLSEIATIGAVVPLFTLMVKPELAMQYPMLQQMFVFLGWRQTDFLLVPMGISFVAIVLAATGIRLLLIYASHKLVSAIGYDLGVKLYSGVLCQPYAYHVGRNTSELIGDINKVEILLGTVLRPFVQGVIAVILTLAILVALLFVDAVTALSAGFLFATLYFSIIQLFRARLGRNSKVIASAQGSRMQVVQEGLGGIRDVILDANQDYYATIFSQVERRFRDAQAANMFVAQAPRFVVEAIGVTLIVALAYTLSLQAGGLVAALPILAALAMGAQRLMPLVQQIYMAWAQFTGSAQVLEDMLDTLALPIHWGTDPNQSELRFTKTIALDNIGFRYEADQPGVLNGVTHTIPKGSRVGVVGETGSGKSTLMDIIMGLLQPSEGQLLIDGVPITGHNQRQWQRYIAHVPQHIYLTDATIAENIALGVHPDDIDYERVHHAACQAQISRFIKARADGYDARVGERGVQLSGGQRQRIGIARALYKQAEVLVFDEASSALDAETETAVMEAVNQLDPDLTLFIIAHRVQTLRACDFILRLEGGRVVATGSYEAVIGTPNDYDAEQIMR